MSCTQHVHQRFQLDRLAERYDVPQLIELPMLVGHYHMVAMTLNSLGVQVDEGLSGFPAAAALGGSVVMSDLAADAPSATTADCLRRWAKARPDHPALRWADGQLTYSELDERTNQVAGPRLHRCGQGRSGRLPG